MAYLIYMVCRLCFSCNFKFSRSKIKILRIIWQIFWRKKLKEVGPWKVPAPKRMLYWKAIFPIYSLPCPAVQHASKLAKIPTEICYIHIYGTLYPKDLGHKDCFNMINKFTFNFKGILRRVCHRTRLSSNLQVVANFQAQSYL